MPLASAMVLLFLVLDPLGNIPLFAGALQRVAPERRLRVLIRELLIALAVLLLFLLTGRFLLDLLQVEQSSLSVAGGVILFLIAIQMIFAFGPGLAGDNLEGEPLIVPLAIPLVAGPSAIATIILFTSLEPAHLPKWLLAVVCAWLASALILLFSPKLSQILGERVLKAMERLMGILLMTVAVQMLLTGVARFFGG